jgi:hypothetical protein
MRYTKLILGVLIGVFFLGVLNGCKGYSCDFHSSEEAQKYVLAKLKDKYREKFVITEVMTYKEEKIGLNWMIAEVSSEEDSSKTARVYARNTGYFMCVSFFTMLFYMYKYNTMEKVLRHTIIYH